MGGLMEVVFWSAVAVFLWGYLGYPALLALLGGWRGRPVAAAPITPRVSLIVSVHNGELLIEGKLENCLVLNYPTDRLEILVASDGSTDRTNDLVRRVRDPRIRLVAVDRHLGKEAAQRAAIIAASGEILVFTDVGVRLPEAGLRTLVSNFADPAVGCVSGVDRLLDAAGATVGEGAFVRYETLLKRLESRVGSIVGNSGWLFALRRPLCEGWPESMASDFTMLLRTVRKGFRGVAEPGAPAYAVATPLARREFARKVRTIVRGMVVLSAHPEMLNPLRHGLFAVQLASHKVLRWLLPYLLLAILGASAVLATDSTFYQLVLVAQAIFYTAGALVPAARI
ncbi:MAG: glycosyltransferase, partial [Gemmatimonadales bacterium]